MNPNPTSALRRAALLLRLSDSDGPPPDVAETGDTLVCPATGRTVVVCDGIVDLLGKEFAPSLGQRMLDTASSAWLYDLIRPHFGPLIGMPSFRLRSTECCGTPWARARRPFSPSGVAGVRG